MYALDWVVTDDGRKIAAFHDRTQTQASSPSRTQMFGLIAAMVAISPVLGMVHELAFMAGFFVMLPVLIALVLRFTPFYRRVELTSPGVVLGHQTKRIDNRSGVVPPLTATEVLNPGKPFGSASPPESVLVPYTDITEVTVHNDVVRIVTEAETHTLDGYALTPTGRQELAAEIGAAAERARSEAVEVSDADAAKLVALTSGTVRTA